MGGKSRHAKAITNVIKQYILPEQVFVEPFAGACNITAAMDGYKRIASDLDKDLPELFQEIVYNEWIPPASVSYEEYYDVKNNPDKHHKGMSAFVGYGLSFAGKKFGGYGRPVKGDTTGRNYANEAKNGLLVKKKPFLQGVEFRHSDYRELVFPERSLIYCDPPYADTTGYKTGKFDSVQFWAWCDEKARSGHSVFVSEYTAPDNWISVWEKPVPNQLSHNRSEIPKAGVEKLFMYKYHVYEMELTC